MSLRGCLIRICAVVLVCAFVAACSAVPSPPHLKPLPASLRGLLAQKAMKDDSPIFIRIFKQESQLEVWKENTHGAYALLKTYPICKWSGGLGPKLKQGDKQAPEGFYNVVQGNMNPHSKFHLAFNLGYPNVYDRSHGRTGKHLMVHGDCKSAGCYAMTDALMEEIYLLARDAFIGGQDSISVHAFPFRMTQANMQLHRKNKWYRFWRDLKVGYDHFETYRTMPKVDVCSRRYIVNASFDPSHGPLDAQRACPPYQKFVPGVDSNQPRQLMVNRQPEAPAQVAVQQSQDSQGFVAAGSAGVAGAARMVPTSLRPPVQRQPVAAQPVVSPAARRVVIPAEPVQAAAPVPAAAPVVVQNPAPSVSARDASVAAARENVPEVVGASSAHAKSSGVEDPFTSLYGDGNNGGVSSGGVSNVPKTSLDALVEEVISEGKAR